MFRNCLNNLNAMDMSDGYISYLCSKLVMNDFYSIAEINTEPVDIYQLENLGIDRITMSGGKPIRDGYGSKKWETWSVSQKVTSEDYDNAFAYKITKVNPPYNLENLLNYHCQKYIDRGGDKDNFLKQIRYVVLVYMKKYYSKNQAHIELTEKWLTEQTTDNKKEISMGTNLSGNNNIINIAGGNIHQSGIALNVSENQITELKELGVDESQIAEIKAIVANKSQDKPTLKAGILKWLNSVTASLATKGLIDNLPKLQEFAHHLIP